MGADTSKIEGQRNDAMRERDEAIANSKREKKAKDEKIKQLADKLTETTKTIEVQVASIYCIIKISTNVVSQTQLLQSE